MELGVWENDVLRGDPAKPVASATVEVVDELTGSQADIFEDFAGGTALANPFSTVDQKVKFYARKDRRYRIIIQSGGLTRELRDQAVGALVIDPLTMSEQSLDDGDSLNVDTFALDVTIPVKSTGGNINASLLPLEGIDDVNAKYIRIYGTHATDIPKFVTNDVDNGLILTGAFEARRFRQLNLFVDRINKRYVEISRNE